MPYLYRLSFFILIVLYSSYKATSQKNISVKDSILKLQEMSKNESYSNVPLALQSAEMALELSASNNLKTEELESYYCFGLIYYYKGFYIISNDYYRQIVRSPNSESKQLSKAWNNMGINYEMLMMLDSALHAYQMSMRIDKNLGDLKSESMGLINIGMLNAKLGRYKMAFSQTRRALEYFDKTKDKSNQALCYLNLGYFYENISNPDSSMYYGDKASKIYEETEDYPNLILTYINQIVFFVDRGLEKKAKETYYKSQQALSHIESPYHKHSVDAIASLIQQHFGDKDSAVYFSKKAIAGFQELGITDRMKYEYFSLADLYAEKGDMKSYRIAKNRYDSLSKAQMAVDVQNKVAEIEVKYKLDIKTKEVESANLLLKERNIEAVAITLFCILLIVALIITYIFYSKVNSANKKLYEKNLELMAKESEEIFKPEIKKGAASEENALLTRFHNLLLENQYFKKPDVNLKAAASELGTNEKYLSQAINTGGTDNFNTYVNKFRVNEARRIILEGKNNEISIEELGMMVGFSNRHTFSRAFNQVTGISPSEFRKIYLENLKTTV